MPQFIKSNSHSIAYEKLIGKNPGVIFCGGFMSDMQATKALALEKYCRELGLSYVRFDYTGRGQSSGKFADGTISRWRDDALAVFDQVTEGPQILIGSSMGGWIGLLIAMTRPDRVKAFIAIAPAPDFTEDLVWEKFSPQHQAELMTKGVIYESSPYSDDPYMITRALIEDGRNNLIMDKPILLNVRVRILQGMQDQDVPWQRTMQLVEKIQSNDLRVTLIKDGEHRLAREQDLALLRQTLQDCCSAL